MENTEIISINTFFDTKIQKAIISDDNRDMELLRTALYGLGYNPRDYSQNSKLFSNNGKFYDSYEEAFWDGAQPERVYTINDVGFNTYNSTKYKYQTN